MMNRAEEMSGHDTMGGGDVRSWYDGRKVSKVKRVHEYIIICEVKENKRKILIVDCKGFCSLYWGSTGLYSVVYTVP